MSENALRESFDSQAPTQEMAVGDLNSNAKGSGARANSGKVAFSQIPLHLLMGVAHVLRCGMYKYASWNWSKGMAWSVCFDCLIRHLFKWWYMGEELDEETGQHHLDHAMCNLMFLRHYTLSYQEGDDRPPAYTGFPDELAWFNTTFDEDDFFRRNPKIAEKVRREAEEARPQRHKTVTRK